MVATLKGSVGKMNDLLLRIAPKRRGAPGQPEPVELRPLLAAAIAANRHHHDVQLLGEPATWVDGRRGALEQAIGHLVQNAVDASAADAAGHGPRRAR